MAQQCRNAVRTIVKCGSSLLLAGGLVSMMVMNIIDDRPEIRPVSIVRPEMKRGSGDWVCEVDMNARFDHVTFQGQEVSRYHRLDVWGILRWKQCREGEFVHVTPAMLESWYAERADIQQRQMALDALAKEAR